jgi:hypothetical protein
MQKIRKILWLRKGKVVPKRVQPEMNIMLWGYTDIQSVAFTVISLFVRHTSSPRARHAYGRQRAGEPKLVRAWDASVQERTREDKKGTILDFYDSPPYSSSRA